MKREILFRGKRIDGGGWVAGDLARRKSRFAPQLNTTHGISDAFGVFCAVDPETVGQHTGLTDKNGKLIFEGDILRDTMFGKVAAVEYLVSENCSFVARHEKRMMQGFKLLPRPREYEVIGNCYDNSDLLEGLE